MKIIDFGSNFERNNLYKTYINFDNRTGDLNKKAKSLLTIKPPKILITNPKTKH